MSDTTEPQTAAGRAYAEYQHGLMHEDDCEGYPGDAGWVIEPIRRIEAQAAALDVDALAKALFDAVRRVIVEGYDSDGTYDALHTAFYAYRDRAILAGEKA